MLGEVLWCVEIHIFGLAVFMKYERVMKTRVTSFGERLQLQGSEERQYLWGTGWGPVVGTGTFMGEHEGGSSMKQL